jgi:hypothetical protein
MSKIAVYFYAGILAASATIFERISLPEEVLRCIFEWEIPNESLAEYAKRIAKK